MMPTYFFAEFVSQRYTASFDFPKSLLGEACRNFLCSKKAKEKKEKLPFFTPASDFVANRKRENEALAATLYYKEKKGSIESLVCGEKSIDAL